MDTGIDCNGSQKFDYLCGQVENLQKKLEKAETERDQAKIKKARFDLQEANKGLNRRTMFF